MRFKLLTHGMYVSEDRKYFIASQDLPSAYVFWTAWALEKPQAREIGVFNTLIEAQTACEREWATDTMADGS